jgi:hypothetical protein
MRKQRCERRCERISEKRCKKRCKKRFETLCGNKDVKQRKKKDYMKISIDG